MANKKKFYAAFHQAQHQADLPQHLARDLMEPFSQQRSPLVRFGEYSYLIIAQAVGNGTYLGEFKRYGNDDLPHAGVPNGVEREIELDPEENTIERNYFLYSQERKLLVWQENRRAASPEMLARYMTSVFNHTVTFGPILTLDAHRTLLMDNHRPKSIEFSVARPTNPNFYRGAGDSRHVLNLMAGLGGATGTVKISANSRSIRGQALDALRTIAMGRELAQSGLASKVRLELEGVDHPIDLLTDRLRVRIAVTMNGRYPAAHEVYSELDRAKDDVRAELMEILG